MNTVAPRNNFRPPCYHVYRLGRNNPPVPLLTDLRGERISKRATIRLAYDDARLYLDAHVRERKLVAKSSVPVDSPDFWKQDHIELRFLRGDEQVQFIATPSGSSWNNRGVVQAQRTRDGWSLRLIISLQEFDMRPKGTWRGIVAHTRWGDGVPDIICSSATELGFSQAERFGEFRFCHGPVVPVRMPARLKCGFPEFTHLKLKGGAVTFRALLPPARVPKLAHPYLLDLDGMRAKLKHEPFASGVPESALEKWLVTNELPTAPTPGEFGGEIHLHEGMAAGNLAFEYDSFYPHLSEHQRRAWRALLTRYLKLYLATARRRAWTVTTIANANPVGNGGCGLAALALWREEPKLAREALQWARENVWYWLDYCNGPDGGNTEGAQYWQYGMENFLRFAVALKRVTGSDDGMLSRPSIRNCLNMIRVGLTNDGALHGINDTVPTPVGGNIAWFRGGKLGLWYGDHAWQSKPPTYRPRLFDMLAYRPIARTPAAPKLPVALALRSIEYGILRSESRWDATLVAGIKGSRPPYTHHNQLDTGAFFLDVRGERLLIDPGYYKEQPTDHCLPLINGLGPVRPRGYTGKIIACRDGYLACDSTLAYAGAVQRVVRHLVLVDGIAAVLLDDIVADGSVTAQYQSGGVTKPLPTGFEIRGAQVTLNVSLFGVDSVKLHPERNLHDIHWGYHFAACRLFPVTAHYNAAEAQPLVAVFAEPTILPTVHRESGRVRVVLGPRREVKFTFRKDGWRLI